MKLAIILVTMMNLVNSEEEETYGERSTYRYNNMGSTGSTGSTGGSTGLGGNGYRHSTNNMGSVPMHHHHEYDIPSEYDISESEEYDIEESEDGYSTNNMGHRTEGHMRKKYKMEKRQLISNDDVEVERDV